MEGLASQGTPTEVSRDFQAQEPLPTEFQAQVAQDMANIQDGIHRLAQQIATVPGQVLEGMARVNGPEESGWRLWLTVCAYLPSAHWIPAPADSRTSRSGNHRQQYRQHEPAPPSDANAAQLAQLQDTNKALHQQNSELQRELDGARRDLENIVRHRTAGTEAQLRESQEEVKKLREKEAIFRTMILDQASVQDLSDNDILQGFLNLRQKVQKISRSSAYAVDTNPLLSAALDEAKPHIKKFYASVGWGVLSLADRRFRLLAKISDELYCHILDYPCFGLRAVHTSDGDVQGPIEPGLRRFESLLRERGGKQSNYTLIREHRQLTGTTKFQSATV